MNKMTFFRQIKSCKFTDYPKMNKRDLINLLQKLGYKVWGKPRTKSDNDSKYQCYRKGNSYAWIGNMYLERSNRGFALDYPYQLVEKIQTFLL